jgi:hypothetical protein
MTFMADQAVAKGEALGVVEFWINRYQQLIAAVIALVAAVITVYEMRRQAEVARRDVAERALTRHNMAILGVMDRYTQVFITDDEQEMQKRLQAFRDATDDVNVRSVMADSLLGKDQPMVAFFLNSARFAALAKAFDNPEHEQHQNMVWPLYTAITNGINERKRRLLEGASVSSLYELGTINQAEVQKAFLENRMPILD